MRQGADEAVGVPAPHRGHGPRDPRSGTPARRRPSLRRTTTHTSLRPDGILGDVRMLAEGRDLRTGSDGSARTLAGARIDATIAFVRDRSLVALDVEPDAGGRFRQLVGRPVSSGFRRALDEAWGEGGGTGSILYQLLDDVPTAVLVSGYALGAAGIHPPDGGAHLSRNTDICAGWASGGTMLVEAQKLGHTPPLVGPAAPPLDAAGDPDAWHAVGPMGPHAMRRWRRIDVWRRGPDGPVAVEAFFRDSHVDASGAETVVHEYLVTAELDAGTLLFRSCRAEAGALPWVECPGALASAGRLVGSDPHDLRRRVRETFVGTTTCTHLNDTLRALAAVPDLVAALDAP